MKWLYWVRSLHLVLGVFFSPLLLLFVVTGWWQTVNSDDERNADGGRVHTLLQHLSSVHSDDYFPPEKHGTHGHAAFKAMVVAMSVGLIFSILLGLVLAVKMLRKKWMVALTLGLGILVPALVLWFD
jgi:hypothetical protein